LLQLYVIIRPLPMRTTDYWLMGFFVLGGDSSHQARDCPKRGSPTCFNCESNLFASGPKTQLTNNRWRGRLTKFAVGNMSLMRTFQEGHVSRECQAPQKEKSCYRCGEAGHISRECPNPGNGSGGGGGAGGGMSGGYGGGGGGGGQECYKYSSLPFCDPFYFLI